MNVWRLTALTGCLLITSGALSGCYSFSLSDPPAMRTIQPSQPTPEQQMKIDEATVAKNAGDYDLALGIFHDLLAENPTITTAYLGIGDIHIIKQDYEKAEPAYGRAARLEPRNFDAQYGHGLALQLLNRFVEAVRAYQRALTINPENEKANLSIATTYLQMKDAQRAVAFAERAVAVAPDSGPAHANLGAVYEELGRNSEAIEEYIKALELMGNRPPLMLNLINVLAAEKRYREAANTAQTLVRIEPSPNGYERLGWCYFKLREYDESMQAYREAVDLDPGHWQSLNGIGVNALNTWLLSKKRDSEAKSEAGAMFRRSLRAQSDQPRVVELLLNYDL